MITHNMLPPYTFYMTKKDSGEERAYKLAKYEVIFLIVQFWCHDN